jgi:hypothetical protein
MPVESVLDVVLPSAPPPSATARKPTADFFFNCRSLLFSTSSHTGTVRRSGALQILLCR